MRRYIKCAFTVIMAAMLLISFMPSGMAGADTAQAATAKQIEKYKSFDLRKKGKVTPVKMQDPFGNCWAFGGIAAAESSILTAKKTTYKRSKLDLSERHATFFALHPIDRREEKSQAGEGFHIINAGKNDEFTAGGQSFYVTSLFATGTGPMDEKDFPYMGQNGTTAYQYTVSHKADRIAELKNSRQFLIDSMKGNIETYKKYREKINLPFFESADEEAEHDYAKELENAKDPYNNHFSDQDTWDIPLKGIFGINRLLYTEMTIKDGNRLPEFSIKTKEDKWKKINPKGTKAVKSELAQGRAVAISIRADQSLPGETNECEYINTNTWAQYTYKDEGTNHVVCIVGWDDSYSKNNFNSAHRPPKNGAWLVKNSWGSELPESMVTAPSGDKMGLNKWGIKDAQGRHTGYFWVSYYDKSICLPETMTFNSDFKKISGFDCEQYDFMPALDYYTIKSKKKIKTANVFKTERKLKLHSVSTSTSAPGAKVRFEVYKLRKNAKTPISGKKVRRFTKKFTYAGFHRVNLKKRLKLKKNQRYSVVVTQSFKDGKKKVYGYSVSTGISKTVAKALGVNFYAKAVVNRGESYICQSKKWRDWKAYKSAKIFKKKIENEYGPSAQTDNFAIKAYLVK